MFVIYYLRKEVKMKYLREDSTYYIVSCERCGKEMKVRKFNGSMERAYYVLNFPVSCSCGNMDNKIKDMNENIVVNKVQTPKKKEEQFVKCPKCGSTQITANNKGYGMGKAVGGVALFGAVGLIGGFIGSKKVLVTCLKCGKQWEVGKNK